MWLELFIQILSIKKDNPESDVTMGSYDGAELCEIVGLNLLDVLTKAFGKQNVGLYRGDGLRFFKKHGRTWLRKNKGKII